RRTVRFCSSATWTVTPIRRALASLVSASELSARDVGELLPKPDVQRRRTSMREVEGLADEHGLPVVVNCEHVGEIFGGGSREAVNSGIDQLGTEKRLSGMRWPSLKIPRESATSLVPQT